MNGRMAKATRKAAEILGFHSVRECRRAYKAGGYTAKLVRETYRQMVANRKPKPSGKTV